MELQLTEVDNLIYYEATNGAKLSYELSGFCLFSNSKSDYYGRIGCYKEEFKILLRNLSFPQFIQKLKNHTETVKLYTPHKHIIIRAIQNIPFMASCFSSVPSIIKPNDLSAFKTMSSFMMKRVFK
jgi:hypothetical protein